MTKPTYEQLEARVKELEEFNKILREQNESMNNGCCELQDKLRGVVSALRKCRKKATSIIIPKDGKCHPEVFDIVDDAISTLPQDWLKLREAEESALKRIRKVLDCLYEFCEKDCTGGFACGEETEALEDDLSLIESMRKEVKA